MTSSKLKKSSKPFTPKGTSIKTDIDQYGSMVSEPKNHGLAVAKGTEPAAPDAVKELLCKLDDETVVLSEAYMNHDHLAPLDDKEFLRLLEQHKETTGKYPLDNIYYEFCPSYLGKFLADGGIIDSDFLTARLHHMLARERWLPQPYLHAITTLNLSTKELFLPKIHYAKLYLRVRQCGYLDHRLEHGITLFQRLWRKYREKGDKVTREELEQLHDRSSQVDHMVHLNPEQLAKAGAVCYDIDYDHLERLLTHPSHRRNIMPIIKKIDNTYAGWEHVREEGYLDEYLDTNMLELHRSRVEALLQKYPLILQDTEAALKAKYLLDAVALNRDITNDPYLRRYKYYSWDLEPARAEEDKATILNDIRRVPMSFLVQVLPYVKDFLAEEGRKVIDKLKVAKFHRMKPIQLIEWYNNLTFEYLSDICEHDKLSFVKMRQLCASGRLRKEDAELEQTLLKYVKNYLISLQGLARKGKSICDFGFINITLKHVK